MTEAKKKLGRKPFLDKLPRKQVYLYLSDEEKQGSIDTFFTKVKEELDIIPAKVRVLEYMQEKAVFVDPLRVKINAVQMSKHPVSRAMGSISLMCLSQNMRMACHSIVKKASYRGTGVNIQSHISQLDHRTG